MSKPTRAELRDYLKSVDDELAFTILALLDELDAKDALIARYEMGNFKLLEHNIELKDDNFKLLQKIKAARGTE